MEIKRELWGKSACGKEIYLYTLVNQGGAYVQVSNVGAAIISVVVPDKDGNLADVALGYAQPESYFGDGPCMGKTCRLSGGQFLHMITFRVELMNFLWQRRLSLKKLQSRLLKM